MLVFLFHYQDSPSEQLSNSGAIAVIEAQNSLWTSVSSGTHVPLTVSCSLLDNYALCLF